MLGLSADTVSIDPDNQWEIKTTMGLRQIRRRIQQQRIAAQRRFRRQKNANLLAHPGAHDFIIILDGLKPAFNIGKIFRSADAFGAREVHLVGIDFFDPAPAMGSFKWVPARFHAHFETCHQDLSARGYTLFTLDPVNGPSLTQVALPRNSAFIFGHEEYGISADITAYPDIQPLTIPQFGQVQSLNVSIAASIAMWEYLRQHPLNSATHPKA
jgi:tRNA G18 (ribose-2'-O)-methylase SpoU